VVVVVKIIINTCFGGFGLSDAACAWLIENKGYRVTGYTKSGKYEDEKAEIVGPPDGNSRIFGKFTLTANTSEQRTNPDIIECVEKLGSEMASGKFASLKIIEIPDNIEWEIDEYDGTEQVAEKHQTWS